MTSFPVLAQPAPAANSLPAPPTIPSDSGDDHEETGEAPRQPPQNIDQLGDGEVNPLNPAGDSLDRLIQLRINDDLWKTMLGDLPCLETTEVCIKELQGLAIQNSRSLRAIDERVQLVNQKIEEARSNNKKSISLAVFEPAVQSLFKLDDVVAQPGQTTSKKRGFLDKVLGFATTLAGINELLSYVGVPLFKSLTGGGDAAQSRSIQITDLQVKVAEIERQRGDLADKIKEVVMLQVLDFDVIRKDFQVSQEIARREVVRDRLNEVDYRFTPAYSTQSYLANKSALDRTKAESYRQWARLRAQLARIKLLVLESND